MADADLKQKVVYQLEHAPDSSYWMGWWHAILYLEGKIPFPKERAGKATAEQVARMEGLFDEQ